MDPVSIAPVIVVTQPARQPARAMGVDVGSMDTRPVCQRSKTSMAKLTKRCDNDQVIVVSDATAAAISPELGDGYAAALTNFGD